MRDLLLRGTPSREPVIGKPSSWQARNRRTPRGRRHASPNLAPWSNRRPDAHTKGIQPQTNPGQVAATPEGWAVAPVVHRVSLKQAVQLRPLALVPGVEEGLDLRAQ